MGMNDSFIPLDQRVLYSKQIDLWKTNLKVVTELDIHGLRWLFYSPGLVFTDLESTLGFEIIGQLHRYWISLPTKFCLLIGRTDSIA